MNAAKDLWKAVKEIKLASQQILEVLNPGPLRVRSGRLNLERSLLINQLSYVRESSTYTLLMTLYLCTHLCAQLHVIRAQQACTGAVFAAWQSQSTLAIGFLTCLLQDSASNLTCHSL